MIPLWFRNGLFPQCFLMFVSYLRPKNHTALKETCKNWLAHLQCVFAAYAALEIWSAVIPEEPAWHWEDPTCAAWHTVDVNWPPVNSTV